MTPEEIEQIKADVKKAGLTDEIYENRSNPDKKRKRCQHYCTLMPERFKSAVQKRVFQSFFSRHLATRQGYFG